MDYLLSVIIPIFNGENNIDYCLNSLFNQTLKFKNLEIILVNHCSTDNSLILLQKYAKKYENIEIVNLNENTGSPGNPRNKGITKATSDYIMFLDVDDLYYPDMCETLYFKIINENVDFVSCVYKIKDKNNNNSIITLENYFNNFGPEIKIENIKDFQIILSEPYFPHSTMIWNKIYKKSFLLKNNIKFPKKCAAEDANFMAQCYLNGSFILMNEYSGYLYTVENSTHCKTPSKENLKMFLCGYDQLNNYFEQKMYSKSNWVSSFLIGWTLLFLRNKLNYKDQKEILKEFKHLFNKYKWNKKSENSSSLFINILENIFIKIFSSNPNIGILFAKIYQIFNLENLSEKINNQHIDNNKK